MVQREVERTSISSEKLIRLFKKMIGNNKVRPADDTPLPPGPWDPYVRVAEDRVRWAAGTPMPWGPGPQPWQYGPHPEPWALIARNHFTIALAQEVLNRSILIHEIAANIGAQDRGLAIGGLAANFVDDLSQGKVPKPNWLTSKLNGLDFLVMATSIIQSAEQTTDEGLRDQLHKAGTKLTEAGLAQLFERTGVSSDKVVKLFKEMIGDNKVRPADDTPLPSGPWDPYIRVAEDRVRWAAGTPMPWGPSPEPWGYGPQPEPWALIARNHFTIALAQEVLNRSILIHEIAANIGAQDRGLAIGGLAANFVDDLSQGKVPKPNWLTSKLNGLDFLVMATSIIQSVEQTTDEGLRDQLHKAGIKLTEAGLAQL